MIFRIYGCFLLGFAIGRNQIHARLASYSSIIKRIALFGLGIGIPLNTVYARTFESESWLYTAVATLGVIPLSAGYASVLALIWMRNGRALTDIFALPVRTTRVALAHVDLRPPSPVTEDRTGVGARRI